MSSQLNLHPEFMNELWHLAQKHTEFALLEACSSVQDNSSIRCIGEIQYDYPQILKVFSNFNIFDQCLILKVFFRIEPPMM